MRFRLALVLLVAAPFATAAPAPDTYDLKLSFKRPVGSSQVVKDRDREKGKFVVSDTGGNALSTQDLDTSTELVYTETVLEKGDKKPSKFQRAYEKAVKTTGAKAEKLPYEGRTVVYTLKDGKYECTTKGEPALPEATLKELASKESADSSDATDLLAPKKPVKVGETWAIDAKKMAKEFDKDGNMEMDADKSKAGGKLVKVYSKGGKLYGVIELTLTVAIKKLGSKDGSLTFDPPATMEMKLTLDVVIDGTSGAGVMTMTGKLNGKGNMSAADQKLTVDMNMEMSGKKEESVEKPEKK
jgi:hypothetical protein